MRLEDLGINPKTGYHNKLPLTLPENVFLALIWVDHVGEENAISAERFAARYRERLGMADGLEDAKREIRHMQTHLLVEHNIPVLSRAGAGGGYYIAEDQAEATAFYHTFRRRGLTGLVKASRGKKSAMVDMVMQLSFEWEELVIKGGMRPEAMDPAAAATPVEVVDAFLQRMLRDPEQFADGLRALGEKYGSVLVPRDRFESIVGALKAQATQMAELVSALEN